MSNTNQKPLKNSVPVNLAAVQTSNWRDYMTQELADPNELIKGYFIPLDDLNDVMTNAVNGARVYFALPQILPQADIRGLHLYIVAVDAEGNDILEGPNGESTVYDTTLPCPTMCGEPNELNGFQ